MSLLPRAMWSEEYKQLTQDLRNAYLNEEYYARQTQKSSLLNTSGEVVIALFVSGSAVSGWAVWKTNAGGSAWAVLAGLATVASILKPFLGLAQRLKTVGSLHMGYKSLHLELEQLYLDVRSKRAFDTADRQKRKAIIDRWHKLELQESRRQNDDLVRKCAEVVKRRYPAESLWVEELCS